MPILGGSSKWFTIDAQVDSGFDEFLTLPISLARSLGLARLSQRYVTLANGAVSLVEEFDATISWDGHLKSVIALALGDAPLIGTQLLAGFKLTAEMKPGGAVTIEALP